MAIYYAWRPDASFIAKAWWQLKGVTVEPGKWDEHGEGILPIWVRFASGDGKDGYMRCEPHSTAKTRSEGSVHDTFWFSAYWKNGSYYYQIRPVTNRLDGPPVRTHYVLKADLSGYMGMYSSWVDMPEWVIYLGGDLWRMNGLTPSGLRYGERHHNLELATSDDFPVKRYKQSRLPYLNSKASGQAGLLTLQIEEFPYPLLPAQP